MATPGEIGRKYAVPLPPLPCPGFGVRTGLSWASEGVKGVYRHVLTLEGELGCPGWFAGDSVGNSDLATS